MYRATFRIIEPMMFRGPGEFDPTSRGVYSRASTLLMPTPSTIAAAIAYILPIKGIIQTDSANWIEEYKSVLGDVTIKGPFLKINDEWYVENSICNKIININDAIEYCQRVRELILSENNRELEEGRKKLEQFMRGVKEANKKEERVGIGLKVRTLESTKVSDEERGLIYSSQYVMYRSHKNMNTHANICIDIIGGKVKPGSYAIKLGGEGRVSILEVTITNNSIVEELFEKRFTKANILYVLSPILYPTGVELLEKIVNELDRVKIKVKRMKKTKRYAIYGEIGLLGAGYNVIRRRKKPIYQALLPGTVICLEDEYDIRELYNLGFGEARELGYGTILPIKVS